MLYDGIQKILANAPTIVAILGEPSARKKKTSGIYPVEIPEGEQMPAIAYSTAAGEGFNTLDGATSSGTARIQFACFGDSGRNAAVLARAVRQLLQGFNGTLPDGTEVDTVLFSFELDAYEYAPGIFQHTIDLEFLYRDVGA